MGIALGVLALGALTLAPVLGGQTAPSAGGQRGAAIDSGARAPNSVAAPLLDDAAPSTVVYPVRPGSSAFSHAQHARRNIGCERCHDTAARSLISKDNLLPSEQTCRGCHAQKTKAPAASGGEPNAKSDAPPLPSGSGSGSSNGLNAGPVVYVPDLVLPTPALKFNHKLHVTRGMACALCHAGLEDAAAVTTTPLPKMALCLGCHDGRQATARCGACHPTLADGRLRTTFSSGVLVPSGSLRGADAHTSTFRTQHQVAGRDEKYCATCHKQSECTECHGAGVVRPVDFHPVDYASLHAVDARRNVPNCSSCHRNQTFCLGCHQRLGVAPDPEGGQAGRQPHNPFGTGTGVKRFHPPGWVRDESGVVLTAPSPASHSLQARRNLRTCVSCHREESCLACHSADPTRSMGVNPHAPGFSGSSACRAMASRNARACLKCHQAGAAALSCD